MSVGRPTGTKKLTWSDEPEMKRKREYVLETMETFEELGKIRCRVKPKYRAQRLSLAKVAAQVGISPNTLRAFLKSPRPRKKAIEQMIVPSNLANTRGWLKVDKFFAQKNNMNIEDFLEANLSRSQRRDLRQVRKLMLVVWKNYPFSGRKPDPIDWDEDVFMWLRNQEALKDKTTERISFPNLVKLRLLINALGLPYAAKTYPAFSTVGTKREKGRFQDWYLSKPDVTAIRDFAFAQAANPTFKKADDWREFGVLFMVLIFTGSRSGSVINGGLPSSKKDPLTIGKYNPSSKTLHVYESKTSKTWTKYLHDRIAHLLEVWIQFLVDTRYSHLHFDQAKQQKLFPSSKQKMTELFNYAIESTHIGTTRGMHGRNISWHITRHTFATHLADEGVPLEIVAQIGGWDDISTLHTYYRGMDPEKAREWANKLRFDK